MDYSIVKYLFLVFSILLLASFFENNAQEKTTRSLRELQSTKRSCGYFGDMKRF